MLKKAILPTVVILFAAGAAVAAYGSDLEFGPIVGFNDGSPGDNILAFGGNFVLYAERFYFAANGAFIPKEEPDYPMGSFIHRKEVEYAAGGVSILYRIKPGARSFFVGANYRFSRALFDEFQGRTGLGWNSEGYIAFNHSFLAAGGLQIYKDGADRLPFAFVWGGLGPGLVKSEGFKWWTIGGGGYPEDYYERSLTGTSYTLDFALGVKVTHGITSFFGISGFVDAYVKTVKISGPEYVGVDMVSYRAFVGPVIIL